MSAPAPKEYEHIKLSFNKSSGFLDGKAHDVTAFLLVPEEVMPDVKQAQEAGSIDENLYTSLREKGSLLHREDGPAYKVVERNMHVHAERDTHNYSKDVAAETIEEEYWEKGVRLENPAPSIKSLGKFKL